MSAEFFLTHGVDESMPGPEPLLGMESEESGESGESGNPEVVLPL